MSVASMRDWQEPRFRYLYESKSVDILAIETISGIKEAKGLLQLLKKVTGKLYKVFYLFALRPNVYFDPFSPIFFFKNLKLALKKVQLGQRTRGSERVEP